MRNRLFAILMILAVLAGFTSCQDQSTAEDMTRTVSLTLSNVAAEGSRTLRPNAVVSADTYYVSLTEMTGTNGNYTTVEGSQNNKTNVEAKIGSSEGSITLTIDNVHIGLYRVDIYGTSSGTKVLTGTTGNNVLTVAPNGANSVSITMNQIYEGDGLKGTVEVPVDWSAATSTRITNGFSIKAIDPEGEVVAIFTCNQGETKKSDIWTFDMDVTPSTLLRFDLYDAAGNFINTLRRTYVWVASGTTSRFMDGEEGLTITDMTTQYAFNIYNFHAAEKDETSATLTWNIAGARNIQQVNIWYGTGDDRTNAKLLEIKDGLDSTTTYILTGLTTGDSYNVWYQAVYKTGMVSAIDKYNGTIRTVSYVTGIDIANENVTTKVGGEAFTLDVSVSTETGAEATDKTYTYTYNTEAFTVVGDTFTPAKAGVYTITATANGSRDGETVTDSITVETHLATPTVTATATAQGIQLTGYAVADATSYEIYRNNSLLTSTAETSYLDSDVATSASYSYYVVAKLTSSSTKLDSDQSAATEALSISDSVINITVANIESGMDIDIDSNGLVYLQSGVTESITFSYEAPSGYTPSWQLNGTAIEADDGSNGSRVTISIEKYADDFYSTVQQLTLTLTDGNGKAYSNSITFYFVYDASQLPSYNVTSVYTNDNTGNRYSSKTADGSNRTIQLYYEHSAAYDVSVDYTIKDKSTTVSAEVDKYGLVTITGGYGSLTVEATPTYGTGTGSNIVLDIYEATVTSAVQLINAVNDIWYQELDKANSDFDSDWWGTAAGSSSRTSYGTNIGFTIASAGGVISVDSGAYVSISASVQLVDIGATTLKTGSANISLGIIDKGGSNYIGTDYLGSLNGTLTIELPYNQGTATIAYNTVTVRNSNGNTRGGSYTVTFDETLGTSMQSFSTTINDSDDSGIRKMYYR